MNMQEFFFVVSIVKMVTMWITMYYNYFNYLQEATAKCSETTSLFMCSSLLTHTSR